MIFLQIHAVQDAADHAGFHGEELVAGAAGDIAAGLACPDNQHHAIYDLA